MEDNDDDHDKGLWLPGKKRPNKGRSHTGITKLNPRPIPAPVNNLPDYMKKEPRQQFSWTSQIRGTVGTGVQEYRLVSPWRVTQWKKEYIDPNKHQPYRGQSRQPSHLRQSRQSRQPSHLRQPSHSKSLEQGGRRTHKHKRKNKHTRRRRVQRRRA